MEKNEIQTKNRTCKFDLENLTDKHTTTGVVLRNNYNSSLVNKLFTAGLWDWIAEKHWPTFFDARFPARYTRFLFSIRQSTKSALLLMPLSCHVTNIILKNTILICFLISCERRFAKIKNSYQRGSSCFDATKRKVDNLHEKLALMKTAKEEKKKKKHVEGNERGWKDNQIEDNRDHLLDHLIELLLGEPSAAKFFANANRTRFVCAISEGSSGNYTRC